MPTVIDSLIVELGLDPSKFEKGQKDAAAAFLKTKDKATQAGKDIEKSAKGMTEALGKATQGVFDLFAAFIGGRGLKEFVQDAVVANTALGNLSAGLGSSPQLLSAWGMAAQRMGGSAAATQASIQTLSDSLVDLRTQGKALPDALFQLEAKSGRNVDLQHGWEKLTVDLANAASVLAKTDPAAANRFLRQLGLDPATANLLIQQGPRMQAYLDTIKRLAPSDRDIKASQELTNSWATLSQQFSQLATKIATSIAPMLKVLAENIGAVVEAISKFVEANPGLTEGFAAIFLLLTGAKIVTSIRNILALKNAILGLSAANAASSGAGLLGLLGRLGIVGAGVAAVGAVMNPTDLNSGENEIERQRRYGRGGGGGRPLSGNEAIKRRGSNSTADGTDGSSAGNLTHLTEEAAREAGIDPRRMHGIRAGESGHGSAYDIGDGKSSFGPWQLHYGGINPAMPRPGLGEEFDKWMAKKYGRPFYHAAMDPKTIADQTRFVAQYLKTHSPVGTWFGYHGDRDANPRWGDSGYVPDTKDPLWKGGVDGAKSAPARNGAAHAAALNNIANDNRATTTSSSNEMHINGGVHVNAPNATDAHGIAKSIDGALASNMFAHYANYGPY